MAKPRKDLRTVDGHLRLQEISLPTERLVNHRLATVQRTQSATHGHLTSADRMNHRNI